MFFLIAHILPVCSLFQKSSILKNLIQKSYSKIYGDFLLEFLNLILSMLLYNVLSL